MEETFVMSLQQKAEEEFGGERAAQLRAEVEQLATDIERLRSAALDTDDEP